MVTASKSTYSLDAETLRKLRQLAKAWQVSKTEVVRRAIRSTADRELPLTPAQRLAALHKLQTSLHERGVDFEKWERDIRRARR